MSTQPSLYQLARDAFEATGNTDRATAHVLAQIEANRDLYRHIVADAIKVAVASAVQHIVSHERRAVVAGASAPGVSVSTARGYRLEARASFMDYTLAGGMRLGEATKKDILENVDSRTKSLRTQRVEVAWLAAIASELKSSGSKVKHELKEADLARIRRKVERGDGHACDGTRPHTAVAATA